MKIERKISLRGKVVDIECDIDLDRVIAEMAGRALNSDCKQSTMMYGAIKLKIVE